MLNNLKIFIGYDSREKVAYHVLSQSILANSSIPVTISPINLENLRRFYNRPKEKKHSTEFSISRFLTPYLSNYKGYSLFLDCDFIVLEDIAKLLSFVSKNTNKVVWCVKHKVISTTRTRVYTTATHTLDDFFISYVNLNDTIDRHARFF